MKLTTENIEKLWEFWIGSKMLIDNKKVPVNFLGSVKQHKKLFLEAAEEWIKDHD